jgi:hypothetical protein
MDGWAHTRWGVSAMMGVEAAMCVAGIVFFIGMQLALRERHGAR